MFIFSCEHPSEHRVHQTVQFVHIHSVCSVCNVRLTSTAAANVPVKSTASVVINNGDGIQTNTAITTSINSHNNGGSHSDLIVDNNNSYRQFPPFHHNDNMRQNVDFMVSNDHKKQFNQYPTNNVRNSSKENLDRLNVYSTTTHAVDKSINNDCKEIELNNHHPMTGYHEFRRVYTLARKN